MRQGDARGYGPEGVSFEPCGRDRHHWPHLTSIRPPDYATIPYDPDEGVVVDLVTFIPGVCPGSGSDAMEVPE